MKVADGLCVRMGLICGLLLGLSLPAPAQEMENYMSRRARAMSLVQQDKMIEALPLLDKLHTVNPKDLIVLEALAAATLMNVQTLDDATARKQARLRARELALRAKEQGIDSDLIQTILESLPPSGEDPPGFSERKEVNEALHEAEAAFVNGNFARALELYEKALKLDPKSYEAALFTGNVYYKQGKYDLAGAWFARAIAINPDRETAYRYWGDCLMKAGKPDEARGKFMDAVIAEPYDRRSWMGLIQWGQVSKVQLANPRIEIPASVKRGEKDKTTINLNVIAGDNDKKDGSFAWLSYSLSRAVWMGEKKFREAYPNEKAYRHSLREEAESLRLAAQTLLDRMKDGEVKEQALTVSLANLLKLHRAGLIEAYVLIAMPDAGIAQDYEAYRKEHRDKLCQYLADYVAPVSR
ncbi:MAG TPA: tetratricopeptide repeat protein [Blastocatellia bacterium]|nr:tetratricopeptide repeat protein [Blastocatellia bacterium]